MWCPKCKNEYIDGITTCVDCGCDLVEELPEEIDPDEPQIIGTVADEETGNQFIRFFKYSGILTCGLIPHETVSGEDNSDETDTGEGRGFDLAVAYKERDRALEVIQNLANDIENEEIDLEALASNLETELKGLQDEEANELLSDLRTEASSVYVNKKDKYTDLKFSGYSFISFALIGYLLVVINAAGVIHLFTTFSMIILVIMFTIFLGIGISSFRKAGKIKGLVSEEENVVEKVQAYIDANFTDDYLDSLGDKDVSEEENFFHVTEILKKELAGQFPLFSRDYIDQLVDEKYGEFCDNKEE